MLTGRPIPDADYLVDIEKRIASLSTSRLGILLRDLRESRRFAFPQIALLPELRAELEDVEAGRARPDAAMVDALLRGYDADLDELVPRREAPAAINGSDMEVLTGFRAAVPRWPGSKEHPRLREGDLEVLAQVLGTHPRDVHQRLRKHAIAERIAPLSTARLSFLVHELRVSLRPTRQDIALPGQLDAGVEENRTRRQRPDVTALEALLSDYGADLDQLVPPRKPLDVIESTDKEVLTRYLASMRRWRRSTKNPQLRDADLRVLAEILGTEPREIERNLHKLTGCSRRRARRLKVVLLAGTAAAPAAALLHSNASPASATAPANAPAPIIAIRAEVPHSAAMPTATVPPTSVEPPTTVAPPAARTTPATTTGPATAAASLPNAAVHTLAAECATALAYLAAHAKPGFAHYCRPGPIAAGIPDAVAYTCVPGPKFSCPDGNAEIIIADPGCAATYENEAANSYWDFSRGGLIQPGATQDGRTWDPFGGCP